MTKIGTDNMFISFFHNCIPKICCGVRMTAQFSQLTIAAGDDNPGDCPFADDSPAAVYCL
jgi:hypothetical protein